MIRAEKKLAGRVPGTLDGVVRVVAARHQLTIRAARALVDDLFLQLAADTAQVGRVVVPGFGVFRVQRRKARAVELHGQRYELPEVVSIGFRETRSKR